VKVDWAILAAWAQAIANTIVLVLIYLQMKQVNQQMIQNDDQERWRRSWEFVKFYREELRDCDVRLREYKGTGFNSLVEPSESPLYKVFIEHFFEPRVQLFILLNQLVQHQEVDERMLFGYLSDEFNQFVELGVINLTLPEFRKQFGTKINLLLTLWGTHIKSSHLLYSST
jgi:hypothetical protein